MDGVTHLFFILYHEYLKAKEENFLAKITYPLINQTRLTYNCAHLRSTKESLTFECFDTGWYLVVLGQYNLVLLGIKWYWVDMGL